MNNPRCDVLFSLLNIENKKVDQILLDIENNEAKLSLYLFDETSVLFKPEVIKLKISDACNCINKLSDMLIAFDSSKKSVVNIKSKLDIERLRFALPTGLLQIDYTNKSKDNIDVGNIISTYIRNNCLKEVV